MSTTGRFVAIFVLVTPPLQWVMIDESIQLHGVTISFQKPAKFVWANRFRIEGIFLSPTW